VRGNGHHEQNQQALERVGQQALRHYTRMLKAPEPTDVDVTPDR